MLVNEKTIWVEIRKGAGAPGTKPMIIDECNLVRVFAENIFDPDALAQPRHNRENDAVNGLLSMVDLRYGKSCQWGSLM